MQYEYSTELPNVNMYRPMYPAPSYMMQNPYMLPQTMPNTTVEDPYSYPQNIPNALQLIRNAVAGEREDEMFYDYLISVAPSEKKIKTSSAASGMMRKSILRCLNKFILN